MNKIKRRVQNSKHWVQSNIDGEDEHLLIGERGDRTGSKVHLIVDGVTGENRIEDKDKLPHDLIEKIETIVTFKSGERLLSTRASLEFVEDNSPKPNDHETPVIDVNPQLGGSGGPTGHIVTFEIINTSTVVATDCTWGIRGFNYEWRAPKEENFILTGGDKKIINFQLAQVVNNQLFGEKPFTEEVPELCIFFEYKDNKGNSYFTRKDIKQIKVPSGLFFKFGMGDFHPPVILKDLGIKFVSDPYRIDKTLLYACDFEVEVNRETQIISISIGKSILMSWDFNNMDQIKAAIVELGMRKIRKMFIEKNIRDYTFLPDDFKTNWGGFRAYVESRDSI